MIMSWGYLKEFLENYLFANVKFITETQTKSKSY